jgi:uncharacterized protein YfaS (alpha-2-macroglobulin family)
MNKFRTFSMASILALVVFAALGCNVSTANLSSLKVSKDKEATSETSSFKGGDTIYGKAMVSNNPGKVKVKLYLSDPKGATMPGSEVTLDIDGDGSANYSLPTTEAMPAGSYKLTADMINDAGEKKDSKSATFNITEQ